LQFSPAKALIMTVDGEEPDSTLRRGDAATTFGDMTEFVAQIERRPLENLIFDLPELGRLSDLKFALARQTVRRRLAALPVEARESIREIAESIAHCIGARDSERILSVFAASRQA
jgi:hypothetical protein